MPEVRAAGASGRRTVRVFVAWVIVLLLASATACAATGADEQTRTGSDTGLVGGAKSLTQVPPTDRKAAPEAKGAELGTDRQISTLNYTGKVVVMNVWGSWCNPCRAEAPDLEEASVETRDIAQFVGLNTRDAAQDPAMAFVRAVKITYPSIYDPTGAVLLNFADDLPPTLVPSTLIIDKEGRIAARIVGPISKITLVTLITEVAGGK